MSFTDVAEGPGNQRPDVFIRSPRGLGRQAIIDVAVTGVDGRSRASDEAADRPLQARYNQKVGREEVGSEANNRAALEDIGYNVYNADLYLAHISPMKSATRKIRRAWWRVS